jgi:hypothetical protein
MDALVEFIEDAIAEMLAPVSLCRCTTPVVKAPNNLYWCECHRCGLSVPYTAVVDGLATIARRIH